MIWDSNLTNLRDVLAGLYLTNEDIRRVTMEAGLNPAHIAFDAKTINSWTEVLRHASGHKKTDNIIAVAIKEFPENVHLQLASEGQLTAVRGANIEDKVAWHAIQSASVLEKIIGNQSTLLPISFLELGMEKSRSVARVVRSDGELGSGFLTTGNLLVTNHHVLPDQDHSAAAKVEFNYQKSAAGLDLSVSAMRLMPDTDNFATSEEWDWTAVRVEGNPNDEWGVIPLKEASVVPKDRVSIIQHPGGGPKQVAMYHNLVTYVGEGHIQYLTDTMPGSSGSPVFDKNWNVVALHHSGGWLREPGLKQKVFRNEGININKVVEGMRDAGLLPE